MIVADMQALLAAARQFAEAADISAQARGKLAQLCEALESFRTMEISAFAELLQQAEQYRTTGILPVPAATAKRTPKGKPQGEKASQQAEKLLQQLNELYAVVHEDSVGFGAIDEICSVIGKLSAPEVKQIAEQFGLKLTSKASKGKAIDEIKRKLTERKGSAQRIQPITAS